jgi:hypothetical protein
MRTTITFPDAEYKKLQALARENDRKPNEMLVLLAREALRRRLEGAERVRRFRDAMDQVYSGLDEETVRSLDARAIGERPRRK